MDKNHLVSKLNSLLPGAVLETRLFGRSEITSIWVEAQSIRKIASLLKNDLEQKFDWLENLSVVEFDKVLVVTYFVRSISTRETLVIRASIVPSSDHAEVSIPSIQSLWPMGRPLEKEAFELFGVHFRTEEDEKSSLSPNFLAEGWKGFPLRKSYSFPKEYFGISHSLPLNRLSQKTPSP